MIHMRNWLGMDAPPCGTLSCVDCDLALNLEADIDLETGDSDPGPSPDIHGQYKMWGRRGSPRTGQ